MMTRIYDNSGMATRSNVSLAILLAVFVYGVWELWRAATGGDDPTAYLFGPLFIGGALYGLTTTLKEMRDLVIAIDADPDTGKAVLTLWRPFQKKRIETSFDRLTDWRHWISTGSRGQRNHFLFFREPSFDGTLRLMLQRDTAIPDPIRRAAGEAIEDFERETGVRRDAD